MKRTIFFIIHFFTISVVMANPVPDSLVTLFNENVDKWMNAYNSGDAKNLIPLYSENSKYISSHVNGLVAEGRDQIIKYFQNGINMGGHIDRIEILEIEYSGDLAALFCIYEADNAGQKAIGRNLIVLRKINDTWLIVTHMTVV